MKRSEIIASLRERSEISVLIVGGGINGAGTFRDLALQDVDVLLVDRADFCSGASAASSHMAHGGIRYLENGEFRLVREAVQERNRLIRNAPQYVQPLPTTIPIFKWFSGFFNAPLKFLGLLNKPAERGALVIKIGLMLYDAYTGFRQAVPRHQFYFRKRSLKQFPHLNPKIICTATYYDGLILCPERLAIELLLDGEAEGSHARALNYVSLAGASGKVVTLRDELTGETFEVKPRLLVNAAGPWIDLANRALGLSTRYIGGTKGSHLVLNHPELRSAIGDHDFFFENRDGRLVLIFPFYDKVLVGTSDISVDDPDSVRCTEQEVDYFLEMIARIFPNIRVDRSHIVFRFSGVRPLLAHPGQNLKAKTTGQISRDHSIQVLDGVWTGLEFPVYSLVGGKWTSFRAFSELVTDKVLNFLGMTRQKDTKDLPIGGGRDFSRSLEEQRRHMDSICAWTGLPLERLQVLLERYGMRAQEIAMFIVKETDQPLKSIHNYSAREVAYLAQNEKIIHLDDLLLRRSKLAMLGLLTRSGINELADALGDALRWDTKIKKYQVTRTMKILADRHGVRL